MPFNALVYRLFIATPSDVEDERKVIRDVVADWNASHASAMSLVLLPVGWETHSIPQMGKRPQEDINQRLLNDCDILIGVFWNRLGSDAGKGMTGTEEEIEEHLKAGKPALLYFSNKAGQPSKIDLTQLQGVREFKERIERERRGQFGTFNSSSDLRKKLTSALALLMNVSFKGLSKKDSLNKARVGHLAPDEFIKENEPLVLDFTARSNRMRSSEGQHLTMNFSLEDLLRFLTPLIASKALKPTLKRELESEILKRLVRSGAQTKHQADFCHVDLPEAQFGKVTYHLEELGYITQTLVQIDLTERGRMRARFGFRMSGS